jgi:hypothetical protein
MPVPEPSVKGVVVQLAVDAINRLLAEGKVARQALEARLEASDLQILEQKVLPGLWYPLSSFDRLLDVATADLRADGGMEAVVDMGRDGASRVLGSEHYGALVDAARGAGKLAGPRLLRLAPLLCNVGRWTFKPEGRVAHVEVSEASSYPEVLRYLAQGFIAWLGQEVTGRPLRISSLRTLPDRIQFRVEAA